MHAATHLMFQNGEARAAAEFYVSLAPEAEITGSDAATARFQLGGQSFIAFDSPVKHAFEFTPSTSIFLTCDTAEEVDAVFERLAADGETLMPLGEYPFASRFGWCKDRFGVSWQVVVGSDD